MANQFSNLPPLCDFFEEYLKQNKSSWSKNHYNGVRAGLRRFENWQSIEKIKLEELTWSKLQGYIRFMTLQGSSTRNCSKYVNYPKTAIRWGIDSKTMPQKLEDLYTSNKSVNKWNQEVTAESQEFFDYLRVVLKGDSVRAHEFAHRIFNTFLIEKNLTYKKLKRENLIAFVKYMEQKKMGQVTKSHTATRVRCYLRWLFEQKYIKRTHDDLFPTNLIPKMVKHLPRPLDPEIDQTYQQILIETDDIIYKGIHILRRTGLRVKELMELEFNCIEEHSNGHTSLKVPAVKLYMERRVPLDPLTVKYIKKIQTKSRIHSGNKEP
jgi:site-specific recombinase XerD